MIKAGFLGLAALILAGCAHENRPGAESLAVKQRMAGETARKYDDPLGAAALYGRASRNAASVDRPLLAADAGYREGLALLAAGEPRRAQEPFERAAVFAREGGDARLAARALLGLARARQALGSPGVASLLEEARALARTGRDRTAEALAETGLGVLAPPAEARERYKAAQKLAGDAMEVAGPLRLNLARLDEREGRTAEARAGYRAAIGPLAEADDRVGLLAALRGAARLTDQGSPDAADLSRRAAAVAEGLGMHDEVEQRAAEEAASPR